MTIYDSVTEISGIGPKYARLLDALEIRTIEDLLMHVPSRYDDFTHVCKISELTAGTAATVIGTVTKINNVFTRYGKRFTTATLEDETGKLNIIWFNQQYIKNSIPEGVQLSVSGKLDDKQTKPQFTSPQWEIVKDGKLLHTAGLVSVYSLTEGLTSKWLRQKIQYSLDTFVVNENMSKDVLKKNKLIDRSDAFKMVHFPVDHEQVETARTRLAYEEMFWLHMRGIKLRDEWNQQQNGHRITLATKDYDNFIKPLPFELTNDQTKTINEIFVDLDSDIPMNRLLQGDVGSGKTIVAAVALLAAMKSDYNGLFMAPTQVLATQHYKTFKSLFKNSNIEVQLVTGNSKSKSADSTLSKKLNNVITIGTHAILHNLNDFSNIGLVVIDEQHKFGVEQRTEIIDHFKEITEPTMHSDVYETIPNLLTMTATPIPRSLALTSYGDLELSLINEMPKGRKIVKTWVIDEKKRNDSYDWVKAQISDHGHQVFIVCPFIEESEHEEFKNVKAAEKEFESISKYFSEYSVGLMHGKLKPKEKDSVIQDFAAGKFDILVSTPVIEVGIDIKNANVIIIETPERFGLASLHQLRGRVGRGKDQGYCILIPSTSDSASVSRLKYLETVHNGNKLSEIDMKIRGPGDIYGTDQHGFLNLKVADITDLELIKKTKESALEVFAERHKHANVLEQFKRMNQISKN